MYLLEAIYVDGAYVVNALDHMVDELNKIDYVNNECIVYLMNEDIYIESKYDVVSVNEVSNADTSEIMSVMSNDSFALTPFSEKKQLVSERMDELVEFDIREIDYENENNNVKNYGSLNVYSPQYQYGYGMCWACAVATVQNSALTDGEAQLRNSQFTNGDGIAYDWVTSLSYY